MNTKKDRLPIAAYFGFGLGELPGTANSIIAAFLTMFYTDSIGMAAGAVGTMFLVSKVLDGISDLLAGSIVDKTKTRWGKARPWLLWLSIPTGIALALIFMVPENASATGKLIYAFLTYNLFCTVMYTMVGVAKNSLMPLMTQKALERSTLAIFSILFGLVGAMVGCSMTFPFVARMGGDVSAWRKVFIIYGIIVAVGLFLSFALTKERIVSVETATAGKETVKKMSFVEGLKNFFTNKYFIFALFMTVLVNFSVQLNSSSQTYFYTYAMNNQSLTTSLNLVSVVPTVIGIIALATPMLKIFGKKKCVCIGAAGQIVGYALRGLAVSTGSISLLIVGTVICGLATGPLSVPVNTLVADAVDYGEYLTNKRIEGTGSDVVSFSQKISSGFSAACVGWVLQLTGYVANEVQNRATIHGITALFAWVPLVMLIVIIIAFLIVYNYDKEQPEVLATLEARKQGKSVANE